MNNDSKLTLLKIGATIQLVEGIFCCITIVGAIVGIPLIMGYKNLIEICNKSKKEAINCINHNVGFGWAVFGTIMSFPLNVIGLLPYCFSNYVSDEKTNYDEKQTNSSQDEKITPDYKIEK